MKQVKEIFENRPYPYYILLMEDKDTHYRKWVTVNEEWALDLQMRIARDSHPNISFELIKVAR